MTPPPQPRASTTPTTSVAATVPNSIGTLPQVLSSSSNQPAGSVAARLASPVQAQAAQASTAATPGQSGLPIIRPPDMSNIQNMVRQRQSSQYEYALNQMKNRNCIHHYTTV